MIAASSVSLSDIIRPPKRAPHPKKPRPHATGADDVSRPMSGWVQGRIILQGVTVSTGAIVATDAIITKDMEPYTIVGGNPARLIKRIENHS